MPRFIILSIFCSIISFGAIVFIISKVYPNSILSFLALLVSLFVFVSFTFSFGSYLGTKLGRKVIRNESAMFKKELKKGFLIAGIVCLISVIKILVSGM
ncbi:hypothetical protein COY33_01935 [candidate division WWE3 bacterium CG_4_10_14_0_2_um_filter_42_7]|uniref:Uncharacterized protein n=2 Tax=Katanobacteria TaxID=422282 RepID=A0A2H0X9W9_UNCKA|nr:MAG: hypothetical protein COT51_01225 [candidate division WWE3 bacterium CG08_land_8_20_14_0_20_41_15]PIZ43193.1 MAG: hypothetical protein COY33_01935 [candidate division WWE3 bacterium CG_4_10_14_0_2_um_filter_42_7]